jgi:hypothetical protein
LEDKLKQKRNMKKLELNKKTVAHLESDQLRGINGGIVDETLCSECRSDGMCVKTDPPFVCNTIEFTCPYPCGTFVC